MSNTKPLGDHIEHVIVVMFENRSFDNVLGGLPYVNGVPKGWSNPSTDFGNIEAFEVKGNSQIPPGIMPYPDPREDYIDMKAQIGDDKSMKGFVKDYELALGDKKVPVTKENLSQIMQYYAPYHPEGGTSYMPISTFLAQHYGVSDTYFGSGPVQTWPNRLFVHCGTPGHNGSMAYLNNKEYPNYPKAWPPEFDPFNGQLHIKTVFEQLDEIGKSWKVYYDGSLPISGMLSYVRSHWDKIGRGGNVAYFKGGEHRWNANDFFQDVAQNKLPTYSFIEPRYQELELDRLTITPPNSNHPGSANLAPFGKQTPIDVKHGEYMLWEIFSTLRKNPELFKKTLLVVTYDEHGGLSDHVSPPKAVSPFTVPITNFKYDQYGPRVPAIFINPYIKPQTVLRPKSGSFPFDHTSIIATLREQFGLNGHLTPRDGVAPTFEGLIDPTAEPNFGPENQPSLGELESSQKISEEDLPLAEEIKKHFGTVSHAIHAAMEFNRRNKEK